MPEYTPRKGDFVTLTFDPQSGHEQMGRRPALVVSNTRFNERTGFVMVCPVTGTQRAFPFHVPVEGNPRVTGNVMVEQLKSLDFHARNATFLAAAPDALMDEVLGKLDTCLY